MSEFSYPQYRAQKRLNVDLKIPNMLGRTPKDKKNNMPVQATQETHVKNTALIDLAKITAHLYLRRQQRSELQ